MLDREAVDAGRSASRVEVAATMIHLSDEAFAYEVGYWRQRAADKSTAARTIREHLRMAA